MKPINKAWQRPKTTAEIAATTTDVESFGMHVRDWQHELRNVSSRREFSARIKEAPPLTAETLDDHGQCDAYLAAYVE